jgi:HTH-type transcriptional regulator / antitoxin HigA
MDEQRYGALLAEIRPRIVETPEEHERLLGLAESMMEKGDNLADEEEKLLALIVLLIEAYELNAGDEDDGADDREEVPAPHITLQRLMYSHDVKLDDVAHLFGNPHLAREVLEGKREISKRQAKELGKFFRVPAKLFAPSA